MEHISKQGTVKEGYLTEESAREAALVMKYKYDETFAVYKCSKCGLFHIGRQGGLKMNDGQATLENREEKEGRPHYRLIYSNTGVGFLNLLNENYLEGYKMDRDTLQFREVIDPKTGTKVIKRECYLYDAEALPVETNPVEIEIIEALDMAEGYLIETSTSLADEKNRLLIDTDYDIVNAKRQAHDPPLPAVKTAPEKKAWTESMVSERVKDAQEAKRWKHYVEAMARKGELPQRESPWERKAREAEEKAKVEDEKASEVTPEKVQGTPKSLQNEAKEAE